MKELPEIGRRVIYTPPPDVTWHTPVSGVVTKVYPAYRSYDEEQLEWYDHPAHCTVKVDTLPKWWPYPGTDLFAPEVADVEYE